MRFFKALAVSAAFTALATTSIAGGLSDQIMEAPVVVEEPVVAPAGTSVSPALIVVGILGLLIIAGSSDSGGDDEGSGDSDIPDFIFDGPTMPLAGGN